MKYIKSFQNNKIQQNIKIHDLLAKKYEKMHGEIFNSIEQDRLSEAISKAKSQIVSASNNLLALDFGAGSGNLTYHLSKNNFNVIACDVSEGFLNLINSKKYDTNVSIKKINGINLDCINDNTVDLVATYSVLHHIPDYLSILSEFVRVLKPGGVIYIDHEPSPSFWERNNLIKEFEFEMRKNTPFDFYKYFVISNYYDWFIRKFIDPRYHREGDIHVFNDDHIEWDKITRIFESNGIEILFSYDYLLFRRHYNLDIYQKYNNIINDMHLMIARKKIL